MPEFTHNDKNRKETSLFQKIYPDFTPRELKEAEYVWRRYLDLVWRIYQRLRREREEKFDENPFKR